jgi:hypothetical protein
VDRKEVEEDRSSIRPSQNRHVLGRTKSELERISEKCIECSHLPVRLWSYEIIVKKGSMDIDHRVRRSGYFQNVFVDEYHSRVPSVQ